MLESITFYTKNRCPQCFAAANKIASLDLGALKGKGLNKKLVTLEGTGITINTVNLDEDTKALERLKKLGYQTAPVIFMHYIDGSETVIAGADISKIASAAERNR